VATLALPSRSGGLAQKDVYRYRYIIAFAVALASVLELVDTSIVNVAIPHMMGNLGATLDEIAWVSTGYIVANVIILPLTSWLSERFGRRNYYTGSIVLFTVASFFCGNAHSLEMLVGGRVVQGIGGGALISTAQAILFDVFPIEERATGQAIFGMSVMVGPTLGPTLGGWITDNYTWPWIFYINIPLGILAGFLSWRSGLYGGTATHWEIGIALLPEWRGRGIGWRAQAMLCDYLFWHTPAQRIQAGTHAENFAEQKSLSKAGFQFEGVVRACEFRAGQWRDGYLYSRLRDDPSPLGEPAERLAVRF